MNMKTQWLLTVLAMAVSMGCGGPQEAPPERTSTPSATGTTLSEEELPPPAYEQALSEDMRSIVSAPFSGDFGEMVKRRLIRAAVPFNRSFYFVDKGVQRGLSYEYLLL